MWRRGRRRNQKKENGSNRRRERKHRKENAGKGKRNLTTTVIKKITIRIIGRRVEKKRGKKILATVISVGSFKK